MRVGKESGEEDEAEMGMKRKAPLRGCDRLLSIIFPRWPYSDERHCSSPAMHCIAHRATFTATSDNFTLHLAVKHLVNSKTLQYDGISKISPVDFVAQNPLLFTLSGSKDGILATNDELVTSKTTNHLVECLRKVPLSSSAYIINIV